MTYTQAEIDEARARKAELIRQVREGTPPLWTPKVGWADQFTDEQIWDGYRRAASDKRLGGATPMMVAAILICDLIDGYLSNS